MQMKRNAYAAPPSPSQWRSSTWWLTSPRSSERNLQWTARRSLLVMGSRSHVTNLELKGSRSLDSSLGKHYI